jgi:hypothetical protein
MGATTCNAMEAAPATSPLTRSNARSGPKYHMTPRPLSQGHRRAALGKKRKWKSPVRRRRGLRKNPCTRCQRTRNILGSPAQGGLKNAKLAHLRGRASEDAHDDTPKTKKSSPQQSYLRRTGQRWAYTTKPDGLSVCNFTVGRTREASSWPSSYGGDEQTSSIVSGGSRATSRFMTELVPHIAALMRATLANMRSRDAQPAFRLGILVRCALLYLS